MNILKTLTKASIAAITIASFSSAAFAQAPAAGDAPTKARKYKAQKRAKRMNKALKLSAVQRKSMRQLHKSNRVQMRKIRAMRKTNPAAAKRATMAARKNHFKQPRAILTTAQFKRYRKMVKAQRSRRHMARMTKTLNLTAAQQNQIKAIKKQNRLKAKNLIKRAGNHRASIKPQLKALRTSARQDMTAVLTPAQQLKWQRMRAKRS